MARKTNKTSHVLNLITNGAPAEPETKAAEDAEAGNPETDGGLNAPARLLPDPPRQRRFLPRQRPREQARPLRQRRRREPTKK